MSIIFKSSNKSGPCWGYNCTAVTRRRRCVLQLAGGCSRWLLEKEKKKKNGKHKQRSRAAVWAGGVSSVSPCCHGHRILPSASSSMAFPLISAKSPGRRRTRLRCVFTLTTLPRVLFWLTEPNQKKNNSSPRLAAWFLHRRLSDVVCHFSVHSVVKRPLETQYSNKCFQPLQQTVELIPDPASPAAYGADISPLLFTFAICQPRGCASGIAPVMTLTCLRGTRWLLFWLIWIMKLFS